MEESHLQLLNGKCVAYFSSMLLSRNSLQDRKYYLIKLTINSSQGGIWTKKKCAWYGKYTRTDKHCNEQHPVTDLNDTELLHSF